MPQKTAKSSAENPRETGAETTTGSPPPADPAALSPAQLAKLLGLTEQKVHVHIKAGAPTGVAGTINLVQYVAWLNLQLKERDGD